MRIIIALAATLALAACAGGGDLAMPSGDWHQLNPDKWTATVNDLTTPPPASFAGHI